jgi:DNA polymerase-4
LTVDDLETEGVVFNRKSSIKAAMEREIIYMNVTAFPVAVERVIHPELRGKPVVVAPLGASRSIVTALSAEAWSAGIRKGMVLSKAIRYCRNLIILPPNEPLYLRASRAIFRVLENFSPVLEPSGHGHAYLDITGSGRLFGPPRDTAWKAQDEIRRQLHLDSSLGIASNKMVSRIASEMIPQPSGLQDVPHGNESSFLAPLPVRLLPGIGPQTEGQLKDLNICMIRDIAAMKLRHLALAFGRFGYVLHQQALGIDSTPVNPMRAIPALELETVLPEDSNDYEVLKRTLRELCEEAGEQLRGRRQRAGRVELRIRYSDYRDEEHKFKIVPPVQSSAILSARALSALNVILKRRTRVRSVHMRLTDLSVGLVQLDLFGDPKPERQSKLETALDSLRKRYGKAVVSHQSPVVSKTAEAVCHH